MTNNMTEGCEWKKILLFALPIMAGQFLQQLYNTVDGVVVGNFVSSDALAAVGSCATLGWVFIALAIGMSNGCGVVVSQLFGARRHDELRRAVSTSLIILGVLGVIFSVLGVFTAPVLMRRVLGIEDDVIYEAATVYFRIYAVGLVFQFLYNAVAAILRAVGDSKATLYFLFISTVLNIALDVLFTAVLYMGVAGVAIATVMAQAVCVVVSFIYMFKRYPGFRFKRDEKLFDAGKFRLCLKMGIPTSLQQLIVSGGNLALQRLVNSFGPVTMAAYTVGVRFDHYLAVPTMGMYMAMSSFAGQNTGAGKYDRIKRGVKSSVIMSISIVAVLCVFMCIFTEPLARLFGVDGEILKQSVECIRFVSCSYLVFALYIPVNGLFQGCGEPLAATTASILSLFCRIAVSYGMVYLLNLGYASCWQSMVIGWAVATVFVMQHYSGGKWKTKSIISKDDDSEVNEGGF